jgi:hypothetical protein
MDRLKIYLIFFLLLSFGSNLVTLAENTTQNPFEWLNKLEVEVLGEASPGGLLDRLNQLEEIMTGRIREGSLAERLSRLDTLLYTNQPYDLSLIYKAQALEWVLYKEGTSGWLKLKLEKMENLLFGKVYSGPITKRLERIVNQVFSNGMIKGRWTTIPQGQLIKIRMLDELSSLKNKPGDQFHFLVVDTVVSQNYILFPKGIIGLGVLQQIQKPSSLGRDAMLILDFTKIRALDGTSVKMYLGSKASEMNRSLKLAVGASAAGMLAFGPEGILIGLVVQGKEKTIPAGTEFYLEVKEPVRIYTLAE